MEKITLVDTNAETIQNYPMCGYKNTKHEGYRKKLEWMKKRFAEGLRMKVLWSDKIGALGAIEYVPGQYAWRPIVAENYMVIHCIYIMSKQYKSKGYGKQLLQACIADAKTKKMNGVAVVVRKGSWMANRELFLKAGFKVVDQAPTDFELLSLTLNSKAAIPTFVGNREQKMKKYSQGLYMLVTQQCPYVQKAITEIEATAKQKGIPLNIVEMKTAKQAQASPCAFGTFCLIYNGKVVAENPISNTRFLNIVQKVMGK
jgi:L-amino acid N-acyltransferase YncA